MKHLLAALVTLLTVLPREQDLVLGEGKACSQRYLRRINGKCYYFSVSKLNWFGALNNCLRKGLTLADLSNSRDFDGAIGFMSSLGNTEDFWFGGNDLYHEGRFQYISNGRLVRYYSNFSNVLPAEHSECDDCLEVRIRDKMNMVAAENCLERQYFICSERYCDPNSIDKKRPKHHSHEHLHHFHHDIGDDGDSEGEGEDNAGMAFKENMLPIASASKEETNNSEVDIGAAELPTTLAPAEEETLTSTTTAGGEGETESTTTTPAGEGETEATTTPPAGEGETEAPKAAGEGESEAPKPAEEGETEAPIAPP
ncbi:uncharacterized protein lectin-46Cb [Drosophila kikkawai]|uniref:Uncharacterized protein lectin-46Cb n=1 Tax=Drosophila kikkawai TaxID=30033 RepID=A0A6P4IXD6_DROKI|nr:uncharacterized protein LOC108078320 [Drosophila kikkawai]